jgi:hypothetical protein
MQDCGQLTTRVGERQRFRQCFLFSLAVLDRCNRRESSALDHAVLQCEGRSHLDSFTRNFFPNFQVFGNRVLGCVGPFPVVGGIQGGCFVRSVDREVEWAEDTFDFAN